MGVLFFKNSGRRQTLVFKLKSPLAITTILAVVFSPCTNRIVDYFI